VWEFSQNSRIFVNSKFLRRICGPRHSGRWVATAALTMCPLGPDCYRAGPGRRPLRDRPWAGGAWLGAVPRTRKTRSKGLRIWLPGLSHRRHGSTHGLSDSPRLACYLSDGRYWRPRSVQTPQNSWEQQLILTYRCPAGQWYLSDSTMSIRESPEPVTSPYHARQPRGPPCPARVEYVNFG
jgi:hypothetical protein